MRRLLVLALAIVAVVACGGDDDVSVGSPGAGDGTTTTTFDPDTPVTSPPQTGGDVPPGGPERVEPLSGAVNINPVSFDPAEAEATDGGVLVRFWGGVAPCFVLSHYDVDETADSVTVSLFGGSHPSEPDAVCIELAQQYEVLVPLDEPLGDRVLVDRTQ
jgi:hypothetical protein